MQALGNQYIFNLGNAVWVTVPVVVAVTVVLVLYLTIGRASHASGSPASVLSGPQSQQSPLTVTLAYDQHDVDNGAGNCSSWIFPGPLTALQAPPDSVVDETWARQFGGVDALHTEFKLVVQGTTSTAVQLLDFRVIDIQREPAISGTHIANSTGCGPAPEAGFDIAIESNPPVITPAAGLGGGPARKIPFPFVVSSTDIQQFQVSANDFSQAVTNSCDCDIEWRLALDWSYEGKMGTTVIDDHGKPFQTLFPSVAAFTTTWLDESGTWKQP